MRVCPQVLAPCRALVDALAPARCAGCGIGGACLCPGCVAAVEAAPVPLLVGARAAFAYEGLVRSVLHHGKFRDCRSALRALAWVGAARLTPPRGSVVAPVPLSARRAGQRGYNQAAVVAEAFAGFHRLPLRHLLLRNRETPPQSTLDRATRRGNVEGAFDALPGAAQLESVWLVDDVLTTGATTAVAGKALRDAGAGHVEVAVLAAVV